MDSQLNSKRMTGLAAALAFAAAFTGCQAPGSDDAGAGGGAVESELAATNGLTMVNGLTMTNGLSGNGLSGNGLSGNGLSGNGLLMNPLKTGILPTGTMMNSTAGRNTISYLVRCALASGKTITAKDQNNVSYSFSGSIGAAPEWETGTCNTTCQERMTGCLLAHVNTSGVHIPIWLDSEGAIGWGQNVNYPFQEGSFFGNIFVSPPKGYYCNGRDFSWSTVPGRLGVGQSNAPYINPWGSGGPCQWNCTNSSGSTNGTSDGFTSCWGYSHVVTVWRNFDANTQYKIVNKQNGKVLEVAGSSTSGGAAIQQRGYSGSSNQKWTIIQVAAGKYKVVNVNSGKALDLANASGAEFTPLVQQTYSGAATQQWSMLSLADQAGNYAVSPASKSWWSISPVLGGTSDGLAIQASGFSTTDSQKWQIVPL